MVDATDLPNMRERFERVRAQMRGGGHGPTGDDGVERRITALEASFGKLDGKLDRIIETQNAERLSRNEERLVNEKRFGSIDQRLAVIDGKLDAKTSAADVAKLAGRIEALPTTWQMITLVIGTVFTILGGSFLILKLGLPRGP